MIVDFPESVSKNYSRVYSMCDYRCKNVVCLLHPQEQISYSYPNFRGESNIST
uniref:Uncharacterized protein n=1 Tax=Solanum tuberosum TaxID=4113 RepID=M0ZKY3_SOLTU